MLKTPLQVTSEDIMTLILLTLLMAFVLAAMDVVRRRRRFRLELPRIKTELKCPSCGLKEVRDFKQGDYISKVTGERCKRCGGQLVVFAIYTIMRGET